MESRVKEKPPENDIRQWLESDEGREVLRKAARSVRKKLSARGIPLSVLFFSTELSPLQMECEIGSELCMILMENRSEIRKKLAAPETDPVRALSGLLFRRLLDRARSSPRNTPFLYLYKVAADRLREAEGIHLRARGTAGSLYSLEKESREIGPISEEDYRAIPFPDDIPYPSRMEDVSRGKTLIRLATWFWRHISRVFQDRPVWVEVRDLIQWIARFVPMKQHEPVPMLDTDGSAGAGAESSFDPGLVRSWAENFSNILTDREGQAFYWYFGREMKLQEVAKRMGFKGPSGPSLHVKSVTRKLHDFAADRPWLSADDPLPPNRLAQRLFKETLTEILQKRFGTP